jgi:hypothetical protein
MDNIGHRGFYVMEMKWPGDTLYAPGHYKYFKC